MTVFLLTATVAFLGLTILAEGGWAAFVSHPALIALAAATCVMAGFGLFSGGNLNPGIEEDRTNRWVLTVFGLIGVLQAWAPAYTDRIGFWTIDGETTRWIGVLLFVAGGTLRLAAIYTLGRRFSGLVAIQPGHELETGGVYSLIRHPGYLGLLINSLGWALAFRSGVGVILTALTLAPLVARIRAEEALVVRHFGRAYEAYSDRTSRLIPGVY